MRKIWQQTDIESDKEYYFLLFQSPSGVRDYGICRIQDFPEVAKDKDLAFRTEVVPIDLIARRDVFLLSERVTLADGTRFYFDSDGIWYVEREWDDLVNEQESIRWWKGLPPKRPPRYAKK